MRLPSRAPQISMIDRQSVLGKREGGIQSGRYRRGWGLGGKVGEGV